MNQGAQSAPECEKIHSDLYWFTLSPHNENANLTIVQKVQEPQVSEVHQNFEPIMLQASKCNHFVQAFKHSH